MTTAAERGTRRARGSWGNFQRGVREREMTEAEEREFNARQRAEAERYAAEATTEEERAMWARRAERFAS